MRTAPAASRSTMSVKVPPTSTPMRQGATRGGRGEVMKEGSLAVVDAPGEDATSHGLRSSECCHPECSEGPFAMPIKVPPEFTNEVQHQLKVLQWANTMVTSRSKSGARLPSFTKPANRSARSRQLWIARHRACLPRSH